MERFMELYQTIYKDLYRLAYYYLGNVADAEDVVQDAALAAYENFGKLKKEESFRPWIFKILIHSCRKFLRRNRRLEQTGEYSEASYEPELSSQTQMRDLLGMLSEEERLIVTLTVFGGYKGEEIARILNKNHSTIRSKYRRALKKLELEVKEYEEMSR
ncbi:MAG: RNA polymerase sigma factor [Lachnospiraceae bacterium]|nr:RNA polymerase sigma factor [Lachnospiraceae bacterium]